MGMVTSEAYKTASFEAVLPDASVTQASAAQAEATCHIDLSLPGARLCDWALISLLPLNRGQKSFPLEAWLEHA